MNRLRFKRECPDSLPFDERPTSVYFRRLAAPTVLMAWVIGGLLLVLAFGIVIMLVMLGVALARAAGSPGYSYDDMMNSRLMHGRPMYLGPSRRFFQPYIRLTTIFLLLTTLLAVISYSVLTR